MILRRLGTPPHARVSACVACDNCPDIFELPDGNFAIIGKDVTSALAPHLPKDAGCGKDERIVTIPREVLIAARSGIPAFA